MEEQFDVNIVVSRLDEYEKTGNMDADVLLYQTFPDEFLEKKFNPKLVEKTDKLFEEFAGLKILVCTHDNGDMDSFTRFSNGKDIPRVKCFPSKWFIKNFNVVLKSTISIGSPQIFPDILKRDIIISCKFGNTTGNFYGHGIRESVIEQLENNFESITDFHWEMGRKAYIESLRKSLIAIGAPGWGQYSGTYQCALRSGTLLFAHTCLKDIHYLPHYDLVDGKDFVSYDLYNFGVKLLRLLNDPDKIERIRNSGRKAFLKGYDVEKSAKRFYSYLIGRWVG